MQFELTKKRKERYKFSAIFEQLNASYDLCLPAACRFATLLAQMLELRVAVTFPRQALAIRVRGTFLIISGTLPITRMTFSPAAFNRRNVCSQVPLQQSNPGAISHRLLPCSRMGPFTGAKAIAGPSGSPIGKRLPTLPHSAHLSHEGRLSLYRSCLPCSSHVDEFFHYTILHTFPSLVLRKPSTPDKTDVETCG